MAAIRPEDLPVDPDQISDDADALLAEEGADLANTLVILGQLDPTEVIDGQPRWTPDQQKLIMKAGEALEGYQK